MGLTEHSFLERMELMGLTESRVVTNADRIRSMSDKKMSEFFSELSCWPRARKEDCRGIENCANCWMDWLQREADE